jgi:LysM repeat protein
MICAVINAQNYPTKIVNGKEYYVYTVQKGEGLYSVSKKFNVLQAEIYDANPNLKEGLKLGQTLLIPTKKTVQPTENKPVSSATIIEHIVVAKQTFYSICKMYGVEQQQIVDLNPNIDIQKLKIGQIIKIPVNDNRQTAAKEEVKPQTKPEEPKIEPKPIIQKKFVTYEVQKKETLYSISKVFGVSINDILEANPFAEDGIRKGDVLQIPVNENVAQTTENQRVETTHKVEKKETLYGIAKQYNISQEELIAANPQIADGLKVGKILTIPAVAKTAVTPPQPVIKEEKPVVKPEIIKKNLKIAYLLPFSNNSEQNISTERFIEFYKGSLIALEEAKTHGVSVEVKTFDTGVTTELLAGILADNFLVGADIIIGPAYTEQVSAVAAFAKKNKIAQVVPFTSKIDRADKHDYLYQFNPTNEDIFPAVTDEFISRFSKDNIIFVDFANENSNDKGFQFASNLKKHLKLRAIKFIEIKQDNSLNPNLKDEKNLVVLATSNVEEISSLAPYYKTLNASNTAFWLSDDISKRFSDLPNATSYSIFNNSAVTEKYLSAYKKYFNVRSASSAPDYDLIGYDLTLYFCMAQKENFVYKFVPSSEKSPFMQSSLKFTPQKSGKGFVNCGFFIYNF